METKHILFLKTHIDPLTMVPFPCKIRAPKTFASEVPSYLESGSVADAYRLLDTMYARQELESGKKMAEISGLRDRLMERAEAARKAESEAAEKRAKAAKLLKPMVSVPAIPTAGPTGVVGAGPGPATPIPAGLPKKPVGAVAIQPAGKVK